MKREKTLTIRLSERQIEIVNRALIEMAGRKTGRVFMEIERVAEIQKVKDAFARKRKGKR